MSRLILLLVVCGLVLAGGAVVAQEDHPKPGAEAPGHSPKGGEANHKGGDHGGHLGETGVATDPLNLRTDLAVYSAVIFLVLVGALSATAWKPIVSSLDQREHSLHAAVQAAEDNRIASEKLLAEHQKRLDAAQDEVREIIAEARRDADHTKEEIVNAANKEAEAAKQRAIAEIELARDAALNDLFEQMAKSVSLATRQVVGRSLTGEDHDRLVRESLSNLTRNVN